MLLINFSLYYFKQLGLLALITLALKPPDQNFSISFFAYLLRTAEINWSIFSLLILKELYIHRHYLDPSIFLLYVLVFCFFISNFGFVVQIPQVHIIKLSFNFYWSMFKDFSYSNSSKLLIKFISFLLLFEPNYIIAGFLHQFFFYHIFIIKQLHFSVTWLCCFHRFSIHIPN